MSLSIHNLTVGVASPLTIPATDAGNLIVVALSAVVVATGVTDNAPGGSNTYIQAGTTATVTGGTASIWYCRNCKAGATAITLTGVTTPNFVVYEVTGMDPTTAVFDTSANVNNGAASANPVGATVTTATVGEFVVAAIWPTNSVTTQFAGNEFTLDTNSGGDGVSHIASISVTAGTHTPQWTLNISGPFCAITAAFKTGSVTATGAWLQA